MQACQGSKGSGGPPPLPEWACLAVAGGHQGVSRGGGRAGGRGRKRRGARGGAGQGAALRLAPGIEPPDHHRLQARGRAGALALAPAVRAEGELRARNLRPIHWMRDTDIAREISNLQAVYSYKIRKRWK